MATPASTDPFAPASAAACPAACRDPGDLVAGAFEQMNANPAAARAMAAEALARSDPDSTTGGQAQHALGMADCLLGHIANGRALLLHATDILHRHGPVLAECRAWRDYASVLTTLSGDVQAGAEAFQRALTLAEEIGDTLEQGTILARMGPGLGRGGRPDEAVRVMHRAVALLAEGPDRGGYASALDNLGYLLIQQGRHAEAVPVLREEHRLRDPVAERLRSTNCDANLAVALAGIGQQAQARALIDGIAPRLDPQRDCYQWADFLLSAGTVHLLLGEPEIALGRLREGLAYARSHAIHSIEIDVLLQLSMAEERCGDLAAALVSERALRAAERRWLDEQSRQRMSALEASIELVEKRAENAALVRARAELEQRVDERTAALHEQIRERAAAQELARFWAEHDWLTRLPNRRQLQARLESELAAAKADGSALAVLFVDLDGFKALNDAHGHLVGDRMLRLTARRLRRAAPAGAVVTRFGGDEFVVLLPGLADTDQARAVGQRLRAAVLAPMTVERRRVRLTCSIGVAVGPRDAVAADELLRRADGAMLEAKAAGRNQVCELDAMGLDRLDRRGRLRRELGPAIEAGRLGAVFQPLWDLRRQRLCGVELLARWHDPGLGWVSPAEFIPVAEESGLTGALGVWAIEEAVRAARALRAAGLWSHAGRDLRVSVNVSTVQLADPMLVERLVDAATRAGGEPGWIELELTESVQLAEDTGTQQRMRRLRDAGFTLAIDDFGAGYSSFSYLSRTYFDRLKIDRGLVSAAMAATDRSAVTGSIIAMAHRLGLEVVAEGIETADQGALLADQGCDILQGYRIARPMSLGALLTWRAAPAPPFQRPPSVLPAAEIAAATTR